MGNKILDKIFIVLAGLLVVFAIAKIYSGYISSENAKNIEPSEQNLDIVIYAKTGCIYCMRAKELLEMKQLKYKQIELSNNKDLHLKLAKSNRTNYGSLCIYQQRFHRWLSGVAKFGK